MYYTNTTNKQGNFYNYNYFVNANGRVQREANKNIPGYILS